MNIIIRPAEEADFESIGAIYGEAVAHGTASFELGAPEPGELITRWQTLIAQDYPYLVLEVDGRIGGYAYAGPYRARPAYRFAVENSIYLDVTMRGHGYGRALLEALIAQCTTLGFRQMVAVIGDSDNHASIALHRACGFRWVGVLKDMGWKHERWLDTVFMQLPLGEGAERAPDPESVPGRRRTLNKTV